MCIICTDPNCDHGERCGRVKIYKEGGSASDLLDSRGGNMLFQALLSVAQYFCIATELLIAIL